MPAGMQCIEEMAELKTVYLGTPQEFDESISWRLKFHYPIGVFFVLCKLACLFFLVWLPRSQLCFLGSQVPFVLGCFFARRLS